MADGFKVADNFNRVAAHLSTRDMNGKFKFNYSTPDYRLQFPYVGDRYQSINTSHKLNDQSLTNGPSSSFTSGVTNFWGLTAAPNGKLYSIPYNSVRSDFMVIDPKNDTVEFVPFNHGGSGNALWNSQNGVVIGNEIFFHSFVDRRVPVINWVTHSYRFISNPLPTSYSVPNTFGVYHPLTKKIYYAPYQGGWCMVFDPLRETFEYIGGFFGTITGYHYGNGCVAGNDGLIFFAPGEKRTILCIDVKSNHVFQWGSFSSTGNAYLHFTKANNGMLYAAPRAGTNILKVNPFDFSLTQFGSWASVADRWVTQSIGADGKIYVGIGQSHDKFLMIDPATDTSTEFGGLIGAGHFFTGIQLAANGCLYTPRAAVPSTGSNVSFRRIGTPFANGEIIDMNFITNNLKR